MNKSAAPNVRISGMNHLTAQHRNFKVILYSVPPSPSSYSISNPSISCIGFTPQTFFKCVHFCQLQSLHFMWINMHLILAVSLIFYHSLPFCPTSKSSLYLKPSMAFWVSYHKVLCSLALYYLARNPMVPPSLPIGLLLIKYAMFFLSGQCSLQCLL